MFCWVIYWAATGRFAYATVDSLTLGRPAVGQKDAQYVVPYQLRAVYILQRCTCEVTKFRVASPTQCEPTQCGKSADTIGETRPGWSGWFNACINMHQALLSTALALRLLGEPTSRDIGAQKRPSNKSTGLLGTGAGAGTEAERPPPPMPPPCSPTKPPLGIDATKLPPPPAGPPRAVCKRSWRAATAMGARPAVGDFAVTRAAVGRTCSSHRIV
jgi:hypothetical protein